MITVRVTISVRRGVFDPAARAIQAGLERLGHGALRELSTRRLIDLTLDVSSRDEALALATTMCEELLVEPAIEDYTLEVLEGER